LTKVTKQMNSKTGC